MHVCLLVVWHYAKNFFIAQQPLWKQSCSRWGFPNRIQLDTQQSIGLLWTRDRPVAETSTWEHIRNSILLAGFEPAIPKSYRPHILTLDSSANGIGLQRNYFNKIYSAFNTCLLLEVFWRHWIKCRVYLLSFHKPLWYYWV